AAIARVAGARDEALLLQAVDEVGDRRQRDAEGLAHVAHTAAGMGGHVEENLALRVGEVQLGRALPEELPEDRAPERVEEVEQLLGLRRPVPTPCPVSPRGHEHDGACAKQLSQLSIPACPTGSGPLGMGSKVLRVRAKYTDRSSKYEALAGPSPLG